MISLQPDYKLLQTPYKHKWPFNLFVYLIVFIILSKSLCPKIFGSQYLVNNRAKIL